MTESEKRILTPCCTLNNKSYKIGRKYLTLYKVPRFGCYKEIVLRQIELTDYVVDFLREISRKYFANDANKIDEVFKKFYWEEEEDK